MEANLNPSCIICNKSNNDFSGGFYFKGKYICHMCETKFLHAKAGNGDYEFLKNQIKKIIFQAE